MHKSYVQLALTILLDKLRDAPDGSLAAALSSPLNLSMTRTIYDGANASPAELLDRARFPDAASVEDHLLDGLIPALVARGRIRSGRGARRADMVWEPQRAVRWLTFLAGHLQRLGTRDLAWWHLPAEIPPIRSPLAFGAGIGAGGVTGVAGGVGLGVRAGLDVAMAVAIELGLLIGIGMLVGVVVARLGWLVRMLGLGFGVGIVAGLGFAVGFGAGLTAGFGAVTGAALGLWMGVMAGVGVGIVVVQPPERPARANLRLRGRVRQLAGRILGGAAAGVVFGVVVGLGGGGAGGVATGIIVGLAAGAVVGFAIWATSPVGTEEGVSPQSTLRDDRTLAVLWFGAGVGVGIAVGVWVGAGAWVGFVFGVGIMTAGVATAERAWSRYVVARIWLALHRRLPWSLMGFLEDAHQLGILRQVGAVYQFRHARLQDHLARDMSGRAGAP